MKNFAVVQEHFRKLRCAHCEASFTPEGIQLLREEADYWVVRVHCTVCDHPSGVAIVGVDFDAAQAETPRPAPEKRSRVIFNSRKEEERFARLTPIGKNDVLDAHAFFRDLGADWMRHLPTQR